MLLLNDYEIGFDYQISLAHGPSKALAALARNLVHGGQSGIKL